MAKLSDFLTTFPEIHKRFVNLKGHSSRQIKRVELQKLLNVRDDLDFNIAVEEFWRIGAIAKRGEKPVHLTEEFAIPFIYRRALRVV